MCQAAKKTHFSFGKAPMISSHSHSNYCLHASSSLDEMVLAAQNFKVYSLTEHMPRFRVCDLYPEESAIGPDQLMANFREFYHHAQRLKQTCKLPRILVGMETEWIYNQAAEIQALLNQMPVDFIVGSVHHVDGIPIDYSQQMFDSINQHKIIDRYFDAQYEMLLALKPTVIGHFDLIRLFCRDSIMDSFERIERNIKCIKQFDGIVELSSAGFRKGIGPYPCPAIVKIMVHNNIKFTLSDDAHSVTQVGAHYKELIEYARELGIEKVYSADYVEFSLRDVLV
jgi:histidinol-phosphatase (PHP family)